MIDVVIMVFGAFFLGGGLGLFISKRRHKEPLPQQKPAKPEKPQQGTDYAKEIDDRVIDYISDNPLDDTSDRGTDEPTAGEKELDAAIDSFFE